MVGRKSEASGRVAFNNRYNRRPQNKPMPLASGSLSVGKPVEKVMVQQQTPGALTMYDDGATGRR